MRGEFDLIDTFFKRPLQRGDVLLGVGDDAAMLRVPPGQELLVSIDTLVAGVHFFPDVDPRTLGYRALAVNLSDLAAMGAEPAWATLALTLPAIDTSWLARFCEGFYTLARDYNVALVGGNTTRGPLSITVQIHGFARADLVFRRAAAKVGDLIYVTGALGDAGLALHLMQSGIAECSEAHRAYLRARLDCPTPRVREALGLRALVHAAIDLSDGLYADLGHMLAASGVGATIQLAELPQSEAFQACIQAPSVASMLKVEDALPWAELMLSAGDDYELCFTVAPGRAAAVEAVLKEFYCRYARIGVIDAEPGFRCVHEDGALYHPHRSGYDHFSAMPSA
ncbi:MAG: thiamine-phosphate kinase [Chromatiales bacterium]|jgi:thiamine-monophosphate kinase|nr:thiamine-phosphate kinase [Chromatiales bacterium]